MMTRRKMLLGTMAAGAAAALRPAASLWAKAAQPATPVNFAVPPGACDCHTHIFGDPARFPMWPDRTYTPETASVEEMRALHKALHMDRVVIVNPSIYGTDNSCTVDALRAFGPARARAVAVIGDQTTEAQLDEYHRAGVRGIRINLETFGQADPSLARQRFQAALARVRSRPWHIQIYTRLSVVEGLRNEILASPVPVVIDHFGLAQAEPGPAQPGFSTMLALVKSGKAWVKLSGVYRISNKPPDYADATPLAKALIAANPQRLVWGSDWPHPIGGPLPGKTAADLAPLLPIDDGRVLNQLAVWAPDAATRKAILVENAARLYGF